MTEPRQRPREGVLLMMLAALAFTAMIGFVKVARSELGALEIMVWRGLLGLPLLYLVVRRSGHGLGIRNRRVFALRTLFGFGAMFCFYTATKELALADVALIHKLQPLLIAFAAPLVLGDQERSDGRLWWVMAAGLTGCTILLAPRWDVALGPGLWALGAAGLSGAAHLCVRRLGESDEPSVVVLWFQLAMAVIALGAVAVTAPGGSLLPRAPRALWGVLLGCAISASIGQLLLTMAYRAERAARVAAASYVGPLWAVVADLVVFGMWPRLEALVGGAIIVGAGLWLLRSPSASEPERSALRPR